MKRGHRAIDRRKAQRPRAARRRARAPAVPVVALDGGVVVATAILAGLGVVMIFSTTWPLDTTRALPPHFARHSLAVVLALATAAVAIRIPLPWWRRAALPLWGVGVALLALTVAMGLRANGAQRWLAIPGLGLSFQPAEIAKWTTLLLVASVLARARERKMLSPRTVRDTIAIAAVPAVLMLMQPDLGSTVVLLALVGLLLYVAGTPIRILAAPASVAVVGVGVYTVLRPYAMARWRGFLDPWRWADAEGFQLVQSFVAFGRGGSFGVGLGDGRQKLYYLPEAHTDFILSVVAEEIGLVGVLIVLGAFAALCIAGTRIARRARDPFALLVAFGMTAFIVVPAIVNGAVVMGLLPTTGLTLPFLSYGRTSLLICALSVGVLLRIGSREARTPDRRVRGAAPRGLVTS